MLETPLLCHGGKEKSQDTEKPEGHPVTLIERGIKGQTLSCDDFGLRASAVPRRRSRRGEPRKSLQTGPCSCGALCWLDHAAEEGRTCDREETSNLQAAGNNEIFFPLEKSSSFTVQTRRCEESLRLSEVLECETLGYEAKKAI